MTAQVPAIRVRSCNTARIEKQGEYVLYWMIAYRRPGWNFALQRAVEHATFLKKPLVVLEALRAGYPWASDRLHRFVMDGMLDNLRHFEGYPVRYYPYVEPHSGAGSGLLGALAASACVVVTDDFPCFFLPRMVQAAARRMPVQLEAVDSNGLLPMRAAPSVFKTAYSFRRYLQNNLHAHLQTFPIEDPLQESLPRKVDLPEAITQRWPQVDEKALSPETALQSSLPIDHRVPCVQERGGFVQAVQKARAFLDAKLGLYEEVHNHPDENASSNLSPWLHFGHVSTHFIFAELAADAGWSVADLPVTGNGSKQGWWKLPSSTEGFLDELVTWRELGFNMCAHQQDYDQYGSLPEWARATLGQHVADKRRHLYTLEQFEPAQTHDEVWNAAQRQLLTEGRIHNYMRMLWGKKILEWTTSPQQALSIMIELNNKYALDGRDPNSYSGIFWVLGRYDRPWGPERPILGKIRYMSSESTKRKLRVSDYLHHYGSR